MKFSLRANAGAPRFLSVPVRLGHEFLVRIEFFATLWW
jgi:hypothetical protein